MNAAAIKRAAGRLAADTLVESGMRVGLGTGSTAIEAVRRVGELVREGRLRDMLLVPTSFQTVMECRRLGLPLHTLGDPRIDGRLDLAIDGADEVDPRWRLVKGGGAAMLIEKIVAAASERYAIVVDESKLVSRLGEKAPVPVEVVTEALFTASRSLEALGASAELRMAVKKVGPVITDHGNFVLDLTFRQPFDPGRMEREIAAIPGVVANGIFTRPVHDLFVGFRDGRVEHRPSPPPGTGG
jgi:ribose 5-phosphate isomerase A